MTLNNGELLDNAVYERILLLAVEHARALILEEESIRDDEDKFHFMLFDRVLTDVDKTDDSWIEAIDVSTICMEVEDDVRNGDILGI
jgi:hypothetical protein